MASTPAFTERQGQYLAFIYYYTKLNRVAPAEADFARYFQVSAPAIHQMVIKLEAGGWISRTPGQARSIPAARVPRAASRPGIERNQEADRSDQ